MTSRTDRFRELHTTGLFVMPNPWDLGTAKLLAARGFPALATTSWGLAFSLGRADYEVSRDELVAHTAEIANAVTVPINVDAEGLFPNEEGGIAATVRMLAEAGAAGCSIEDSNPAARTIMPIDAATEAVATAAAAAKESGLVLTARAENAFYGVADIDDTIARLRSYIAAGADVAYAPGLTDRGEIGRVVTEVGAPVNVLTRTDVPPIAELASLGVRRVSTGGGLCRIAIAAVEKAIDDLLSGSEPRITASS
ncbi:MAG TPA: isocitrate lyase/phosphoenolpyruvate mutase family protein [Acidimicrobiia bacterium]|nr:isocitrate lyase/phosphoenolpyruvate mutase family protein [Acidimicrobiia bacterium]